MLIIATPFLILANCAVQMAKENATSAPELAEGRDMDLEDDFLEEIGLAHFYASEGA